MSDDTRGTPPANEPVENQTPVPAGKIDLSHPDRSPVGEPILAAGRSRRAHLMRRIGLGFAAGWAILTFVLPMLLLVWLGSALFGLVPTAELLEDTGGLSRTTFRAGYIAGGAILIGATVGLGIAKLIRRRRRDGFWKRLALHPFLIPAILFALLSIVSAAFEYGGADVPDALTTTAFLGAWGWIAVLLPLWILLGTTKWAWRSFRWAVASVYRTGLVTGLAVGVALLSTVSFLLPYDDSVATLGAEALEIADAVDSAPAADGFVPESRAIFAAVAALDSPEQGRTTGAPGRDTAEVASAPSEGYRNAFGECAEGLYAEGAHGSVVDQQVGRLARRGFGDDAVDVVYLTLLVVCERYAAGRVDDYVPYFVVAVTNNARSHRRSDSRLVRCVIDEPGGGPGESSELGDIQRAFCGLTEDDKKILFLAAHGLSSAEMAELLHVTPAAVRQRLSRARTRFGQLL